MLWDTFNMFAVSDIGKELKHSILKYIVNYIIIFLRNTDDKTAMLYSLFTLKILALEWADVAH